MYIHLKFKIKKSNISAILETANKDGENNLMNVFEKGPLVNLEQVLDNREWRSAKQMRLETDFPEATIVAVKLNLPGNVKNSPAIEQFYNAGWRVLLESLNQWSIQKIDLDLKRATGPEGFIVVSKEINEVKRAAIHFEEDFILGRFFDSDVMAKGASGYQLSRQELGFAARRCFVCDDNAKACAKAGRHSFEELKEAVNQAYQEYFVFDPFLPNWNENMVVRSATFACLAEVVTNPKPGLVDPVSVGAHDDMDVETFIDSSLALEPYFASCMKAGRTFSRQDLTELLATIRPAGIAAEQAMKVATNGVNTHKGAIFTLGILIAAYGFCTKEGQSTTLSKVQEVVSHMGAHLLSENEKILSANDTTLTAGQQQYQKYRLAGVRGEVADGLKPLSAVALPVLRDSVGTTNERLLDTLMAIAGSITDSTLVKRAGNPAIQKQMVDWVEEFQKLGGASTPVGMEYLKKLDQRFIDQHLSIGGAADYLILTAFIARLMGMI